MTEEQDKYFEDELIVILEDALGQEHRAHDFYLNASTKRPWKPEAKDLLEWLANEESKHANLITERIKEIKARRHVLYYKIVPDENTPSRD